MLAGLLQLIMSENNENQQPTSERSATFGENWQRYAGYLGLIVCTQTGGASTSTSGYGWSLGLFVAC
jgi:hypothetical protein